MNEKKQNLSKGCLITLGSFFRAGIGASRPKSRGQSTIEFAALIAVILAALFLFQKYIFRGMAGRWKGVGDSLGQGRIFDPNHTTECEFHPAVGWYDRICYENTCRSFCGLPDECAKTASACLIACGEPPSYCASP